MNTYRAAIRLLLSAALFGLLFGCAQTPTVKVVEPTLSAAETEQLTQAQRLLASGDYAAAALQFERLSVSVKPALRDNLLLRAANAYSLAGEYHAADALLRQLAPSQLEGMDQLLGDLLRAEVLLARDQHADALALVSRPLPLNAPNDLAMRIYRLRAEAQGRAGEPLKRAAALMELDGLLIDPQQRLDNQKIIIDTLIGMTQASLQLLRPGQPDTLGGWMDLARLVQTQAMVPETTEAALTLWRQTHPAHPAMPELLEQYRVALGPDALRYRSIAVLLPRSGRFAPAAAFIQDGLMASYYNSAAEQRPLLRFYDSSDPARTWPLLQQALADGAEAVIGPLQKEAVQQLAQAGELPLPVLALNQVDLDINPPAQLYQFGLPPEDEARQVAERAWHDGATSALALVPDTAWGKRMLESFQTRWEALGGELVEHAAYDPAKYDFTDTIKALLNLDESQARQQSLVRTLGKSLEFTPRRRADASALFLAASADKARQLWPQLQFHRAGDLPTYSSSRIHTGQFDATRDLDLIGLNFPDIPWLLATDEQGPLSRAALPAQLTALQGTPARLFSMGMDSYRLLAGIERLKRFPGANIAGASGQLTLDELRRTRRQLNWARITAEGIQPLDRPVASPDATLPASESVAAPTQSTAAPTDSGDAAARP